MSKAAKEFGFKPSTVNDWVKHFDRWKQDAKSCTKCSPAKKTKPKNQKQAYAFAVSGATTSPASFSEPGPSTSNTSTPSTAFRSTPGKASKPGSSSRGLPGSPGPSAERGEAEPPGEAGGPGPAVSNLEPVPSNETDQVEPRPGTSRTSASSGAISVPHVSSSSVKEDRDRDIKIWLVDNFPVKRLRYLCLCVGFTNAETEKLYSSPNPVSAEDLMCQFVERYLEINGNWSRLLEALLKMKENALVAELRDILGES